MDGLDAIFCGGLAAKVEDGKKALKVKVSVLAEGAVIGLEMGDKKTSQSIVAHALRIVREDFEETDKKGQVVKKTRILMPELWRANIDVSLEKILIQAGSKLYGVSQDGSLVAMKISKGAAEAKLVWKAEIEGEATNMLAADGKLFVITAQGRIYCFGENPVSEPAVISEKPDEINAPADDWTMMAEGILEETGVRQGYALCLGLENGRLIEELARWSDLHVIGLDPDARKIKALRRRFDDLGLYGKRVAFLPVDIGAAELPPYMASLVVSENLDAAGLNRGEEFAKDLFHILRPYGGTACFNLKGEKRVVFAENVGSAQLANAKLSNGPFVSLKRAGALPGSADWTHQYGDASNNVFSPDRIVKAPLGLLWFGGPSNKKILPRHGHGPSPQVVGGRLFIEGPDILRAVDVYTGRLLWEKDLPDVGKAFDNTSHEPGANATGSNYVSMPDGVYVVHEKKCLRLDPATGETLKTFKIEPLPGEETPVDWGYIGVWENILVAGARPMSFWTPNFVPYQFEKMFGDEEKVAKCIEIINSWVGFDLVERSECKTNEDFILKNLNKMIRQKDMVSKIPESLRAERSPENLDKMIADLSEYLKQQPGPLENDPKLIRLNRKVLSKYYNDLPGGSPPSPGRGKDNVSGTASSRLVAMDRYSGEVLWRFDSHFSFRHNAIALGGGKAFFLDRLPDAIVSRMRRYGKTPVENGSLTAVDIRTGDEIWRRGAEEAFGTWLGYSEEYDALLQAGSYSIDRLNDEQNQRMAVYRGKDGEVLWDKGKDGEVQWDIGDNTYDGPCILHHDTIITQSGSNGVGGGEVAYNLLTGEKILRRNPLTGEIAAWTYRRLKGCNTAIASEHLLTFRSASASYFDLTNDGGTGSLGGYKSGCTSNLIAANGVLNSPDYTRTCSCDYQNQTSLAMIHMPDAEVWTFSSRPPIRQVGINLGAPGDRVDERGILWVDYPSVGGGSLEVPITIEPAKPHWFRKHSYFMRDGGVKWIAASGARGLRRISVKLRHEHRKPGTYTIRLHFAEPENKAPGERVFNVAIQDMPVLTDFDVVAEAGGPNRGIVMEFKDIEVLRELVVALTPSASAPDCAPTLCGIEAVQQMEEK